MIVASLVHVISSPDLSPSIVLQNLSSTSYKVQVFLVLGLLFSSIGGLVVAAILKKLDNVVKEYSSATANMFTAVLSTLLFPDKFEITIFILLAMALLFTGIYLYEKKSFKSKDTDEESKCDKTMIWSSQLLRLDEQKGRIRICRAFTFIF